MHVSTGPSRSVPGYACPFAEQTEHIQKRARLQPALLADRIYMLTPDWWDSPRFQAVFLAQGWFRQSGVISSHPPAGNASRWAAILLDLLQRELKS